MTKSNSLKVLILRFSSIGDIVLTTPVIRGLKEQLSAEVHYLTKKKFAANLIANPHIDRLWTFEKEVTEVMPQLRQEKFDHIIDLHANLRSLRVKLSLPFTKSHTFNKINLQKWLLTKFKINRLPDIHIVDRYLAAAEDIGVKNDGKGLDYFIPTDTKVELPATPYIGFVIGAAHATKRLPEEKIIAICQQIQHPIYLLGGPAEKEVGNKIVAATGKWVHNKCGHLSLHASAAFVKNANLVISHDTGLMHIAAAFQRPIVSIWGNTVPEFGMYPYYGDRLNQNQTIEVTGLACRPCSKIGYAQCPKGHFRCMQNIPVNPIKKTVQEILNP